MVNILGLRFGSKFPKTEKYERENQQLLEDANKFHELEKSEDVARYYELDTLIHSGDFEKKVLKLKKEKFKDTEAYAKYKKYKEHKGAANVRRYLKILKEDYSDEIKALSESDSIIRLNELEQFINNTDFAAKKADLKEKKVRFKDSDTYSKQQEYKQLKKSSSFKRYQKLLKIDKSEELHNLQNSTEIQHYLELKEYVNSKEFADIKAEVEDKDRFKKSKEHQLIEEFKALSKQEEIVWFLQKKEHNSFHEVDKWKMTFEDDFNSTKLDESKWITGYYWGKALMNDVYVQANEKQFFKADNIELRDSYAHIVTKAKTCKGKIWEPTFGFRPQTFNYTSGLISTGQSFRQLYGRFVAKIKYSHTFPVAHTFCLLAEQITPQVNILKSPEKEMNKIEAGSFWSVEDKINQTIQKIKFPGSSEQFYVYELVWSKDKLEWKINGVTVHTQTNNIPQVPMYLSLSTHLTTNPNNEKLPISMDIDWVRCYQLN
jgi:hypothetical protein